MTTKNNPERAAPASIQYQDLSGDNWNDGRWQAAVLTSYKLILYLICKTHESIAIKGAGGGGVVGVTSEWRRISKWDYYSAIWPLTNISISVACCFKKLTLFLNGYSLLKGVFYCLDVQYDSLLFLIDAISLNLP